MDFLILAVLISCFLIGLAASLHQYLQHRRAEKKKLYFSLLQKIQETESILEHSVSLCLSKSILLTLEKRVLRLLKNIYKLNESQENYFRIQNQTKKVKQTADELYVPSTFTPPSNRQISVFLIQQYRQLKRILRDELAENTIDLALFKKDMRQISYFSDLILMREKIQNVWLRIQKEQYEQAAYLFGLLCNDETGKTLFESLYQEEKIRIEHALAQSEQLISTE